MGRSWGYVAAWMAATAAAVTVSWLGVRVGVAPALTSESPVAIDVDRRYTEVRLGPSEIVPQAGVTAAPVASTPPTPARATPAASAPTPSASPRSVPTRSAPTPGPTSSPGSTVGPPASTRARPRAAATPSPSRATAPDRRPRYRIRAQGGVVTVAYSATRVDVVAADPIAGYTTAVDRRGERLLVVRLAGPTHASVVTVYWLGGPGARIMEESTR